MTLLDFEELTEYWSRHPPVHLMLASFFGIDSASGAPARSAPAAQPPAESTGRQYPRAVPPPDALDPTARSELATIQGVAQADARVQHETPGVVFDFDQLKERYLERIGERPPQMALPDGAYGGAAAG